MVTAPSNDLKRNQSKVSVAENSVKAAPSNVVPFRDIAKEGYVALAESRVKRQQLQRLRYKVLEVLAVTAGAGVLASAAAIALVRFLPYQISQEQRLREINAEVTQLEAQVKVLRDRLAERFGTVEPDSAFLRRHGWLRPGQFVVRFLDQDRPTVP